MNKLKKFCFFFIVFCAFGFDVCELLPFSQEVALISSAEARVGRPLSPVSVAGVARRSSRRSDRRD